MLDDVEEVREVAGQVQHSNLLSVTGRGEDGAGTRSGWEKAPPQTQGMEVAGPGGAGEENRPEVPVRGRPQRLRSEAAHQPGRCSGT